MPSQAGSATKICSRFHNVRSTTLAKSPRCRLPDSLVMPNAIADCKGHSLRVRCRQVAHKNSFDARRFKCVFITRDCVTGAATMQARSVIGVVLNSCGRRSSPWLDSTGAQRRHYVRIKTSPDVLVLAISPMAHRISTMVLPRRGTAPLGRAGIGRKVMVSITRMISRTFRAWVPRNLGPNHTTRRLTACVATGEVSQDGGLGLKIGCLAMNADETFEGGTTES